MSDGPSHNPWLTIIGLGEDGPEGLSNASRQALDAANVVMGPPRHLALIEPLAAQTIPWPVPFAEGIETLMSLRGQQVVVLASGDPFWFGAGRVITKHLSPGEWRALPGASCFALAANRLGWALEQTQCLALHAAPFSRIRPHLANGRRIIATLRDGDSVTPFTNYLIDEGFGETLVTVYESLAGPDERCSSFAAQDTPRTVFKHPLVVALEPKAGAALPLSTGRADGWFEHDGQITKRLVRAMTLSTLAPLPGEHLWDIGGGSGSVAIEWLLCDASLSATSFEKHPERVDRIARNAQNLGQDRLHIVVGEAAESLEIQSKPDAIFIGGGLSAALIATLRHVAPNARIVANAVTLESEALLLQTQAELGGSLTRIDLSEPTSIGPKHGWRAAYPILQWSFAP